METEGAPSKSDLQFTVICAIQAFFEKEPVSNDIISSIIGKKKLSLSKYFDRLNKLVADTDKLITETLEKPKKGKDDKDEDEMEELKEAPTDISLTIK